MQGKWTTFKTFGFLRAWEKLLGLITAVSHVKTGERPTCKISQDRDAENVQPCRAWGHLS